MEQDPRVTQRNRKRIKSGYVTNNGRRAAAVLRERLVNGVPVNETQREWLALVEREDKCTQKKPAS